MMQLRRSFLVMTVSALLAACGGGGGDSSNDSAQPENNLGSQPTETTTIVSAGQFVDAPVVGLHYQTETQSGETDQYGRFSFIKGETVSFYIGDQLLGSAIAKNTVTPLDLVPESKRFVDSLEVSNILRLLQTLDVDTTDDVIELTAATHQAFIGTSYDLTLPFDSALEQQLAQVTIQQPNGAQQLVSAADAQAHFVETLQQFTVKPEYDFDTDGDGIGNKQDPDDDNDGIADEDDTTPQGGIDTDLDGIENDIDDDDDNDGVLDINDVFPLDKDESADTDSDGIGNNADADDDNDGVEDSADAFPLNYAESVDTDGDGIGNTADIDDDNDGVEDDVDVFPLNHDESVDTDDDGIGNTADTDDDNDGVIDAEDAFPLNKNESVDTDGDGIGNNADTDDDNDGVIDTADDLPLNKDETVDTDGDGIGNNADTDDDNDGVIDTEDDLPLNKDETVDTDGDGIGNNADTDDDNDGVSDAEDAFPLDKNESVDTDGDGIGNNQDTDDDNDGVIDTEDDLPLNKDETVDTDGDGIGNNADTDDDNDGVSDAEDEFPLDKNESVDTDGDGIGNNADTDDDNDGVIDTEDDLPLNKDETVDTDSDGIGNNADTDDDNDGVADVEDEFPLDKNESVDTDGDGIGNNADTDDDNDGVIDTEDDLPLNKDETVDTDGDGIGNNADTDDDNDGVTDAEDVFPLDKNESVDTDGDGTGNNADKDDDNDFILDTKDAFPLDPSEWQDTDNDGIGNNADLDDDGDGVADVDDSFPLDKSEWADNDYDGMGDNSDLDDDNDGLYDDDEINLYGSNPFLADTDGDHLTDFDEVEYGLSALNPEDAKQDIDGDGFSNIYEIYAETLLDNSDDKPEFSNWGSNSVNGSYNQYQPLYLEPEKFSSSWHKSIYSTIFAVGNGLFYAVEDEFIQAFELDTGKLNWEFSLPFGRGKHTSFFYPQSVYVQGRVVLVIPGQYDEKLLILDAQTGEILLEKITQANADDSKITRLLNDDRYLFIANRAEAVISKMDPVSGMVLWEFSLPDNAYDSLRLSNNKLIVSHDNVIHLVDKTTGNLLLSKDIGFPPERMVVGSTNNLLLYDARDTRDELLMSFDLDTLETNWAVGVGTTRNVYPVARKGEIFHLEFNELKTFNEQDGSLLRTRTSPTHIFNGLLVTANIFLIHTGEMTYAVDVKSQRVVWSHVGRIIPIIDRSGILFLRTDDGIQAINANLDLDADGLPDWWERKYNTDLNPDSDNDNDQLTNVDEFLYFTSPVLQDTDGDGLSDKDELSLYDSDPRLADTDSDGLSDYEEIVVHESSPTQTDSDDDSISDYWEIENGMDANNAGDALLDNDNDGFLNKYEVLAGTDVNAPDSFPKGNVLSLNEGWASATGYQPILLDMTSCTEIWREQRSNWERYEDVSLSKDRVFLKTDNKLQALNIRTGELQWESSFSSSINVIMNEQMTLGTPVAGNGKVYVETYGPEVRNYLGEYVSDNAIHVLDEKTGAKAWSVKLWGDYSEPDPNRRFTWFEDMLLLNFRSSPLRYSNENGSLLSEYPSSPAVFFFPPSADQENIYLMHSEQYKIDVYDRLTEHFKFSLEGIGQLRKKAPIQGRLNNIILSGFSRIASIDKTTGKVLWKVPVNNDRNYSLVVGNGIVYAVFSDNILAIDENNGTVLWTWEGDGVFLHSPILTLNYLLMFASDSIVAFDLTEKRITWSFPYFASSDISLSDEGILVHTNGDDIGALQCSIKSGDQ